MKLVKTAAEWVLAAAIFLLLLPLMALAALGVLLTDGPPVLYFQERVGRNGRIFRLAKFRSMRVNQLKVSETGQVDNSHPLVTPIGRFLRRTKIDELPQLLNVLTLDMAMVGPRPTVEEQVRQYDDFQRRRLLVRPGLTGWAQINGNVALSWAERILLDVWYVDHWSLALDFRILAATAAVVIGGERRNDVALEEARAYALATGWRG